MNRTFSNWLAACVILPLLFPLSTTASEQPAAEHLCKSKIEDVYGVSNFRNVWSEREGNHKFRVHGQVKRDNHKYDFNCKVKHGSVKSYAYDGPHNRHRDKDDDDDSNMGAVVAVGAGLAIIAALAASQAGDEDDHDGDRDRGRGATLPVSKSVLEDECHDMLQYRIRDEHDYTAQVSLKEARLEGHDMVGDAKVRYDRDHPRHATYTCHFDSRGRLMDSRYHLY